MESRYIYPAIITKDITDETIYNINFPDFENCFTFGEDLEDTLDSAKDILQLTLYDLEQEKKQIPNSSKIEDIILKEGQNFILIDVWMVPFRDKMENTSVKKTITIPKWLNDVGEKENINFSQVMQSAIKDIVGIKNKF